MTWQLKPQNLKHYPHFDSEISLEDAIELISSPSAVAIHPFYPFLYYNKGWNKWAPKGGAGVPKSRPIRYAARRDSYIFSKYRNILSEIYETKLAALGLTDTVLAYRKIESPGGGGKCNIDFAKTAFDKIKSYDKSVVLALDISQFFESLDHGRIKALWCDALGTSKLPADHFNVFKAITKYSYINRDVLYKELGIVGTKTNPKNGATSIGYLIEYNKMPKPQICPPQKLRALIAKNTGSKEFLNKNENLFGIPQGAPMSDLIANFYLLDFDVALQLYVTEREGFYCRYSDDILIILPGEAAEGEKARTFAASEIAKLGNEIKIKDEKTYVYTFERHVDGNLRFMREIGPSNSGANGLEYLGFRFDGKNVFIRDATMSNLWRKVSKSANRFAVETIKRYRGKSLNMLKDEADIDAFIRRFGRVERFDELSADPKNWTFWTYVKRSMLLFGPDSQGIRKQLKKHKSIIRAKILSSLDYYYTRIPL